MAKRGKPTRIEPSFDVPARKRSSGELRVDASDRVAAAPRKTRKPAKAGPARRKQAKKKTTRKRGGFMGFFGKLTYWSFVLCLWGGIGLAAVLGYFAATLPQSSTWSIPQRPPNARIVSADGQLIANRGLTGGATVRLDEMSPYIPKAVIAIEDRRFHSHFGFDPIGFSRAMITNLRAGRFVQGGSTLTQQLAKNLFLKPERTIERKVQELILAFWLETKYSKDEILEIYLNRVYFGSNAYGVDAASRRYFSKPASDVNLAEAALLAGLLKAPSRLSPARNPELAEERAQIVLASMKQQNIITDKQAASAMTVQAKKAKRFWSGSEHYVADLVMKQVPELIGELTEDVVVETTLNMKMQRQAGEVIADTLKEHGKARKVSQGALVSMTPRGQILALVGGREYSESQYNRATEAKRQPGSAFKPIVYLAALEAGRTPESVRQDAPVRIGKWTPVNYDRKYRGPVTLDTALTKSLNTVAAQLVMEVGPKTVVETAKRLGITSDLTANASIALGTSEVTLLELTSAFVPFANGGEGVDPHVIQRITSKGGKVLYERQQKPIPTVIRQRELGMMNAMMKHVITQGTGRAANLGSREAAGKTGTTQSSRDGLFVGYTADIVTGIWYGNDDNSATKKVTGGSLPAQSWKTYMTAANSNHELARLPGNYEPQVAAVPRATPQAGIGGHARDNASGGDVSRLPASEQARRRRTLSEVDGAPRPTGNVGGQREKPRSILDIIFGG